MTTVDDVPELEGYVLLSTAGRELGISRQRTHIIKKRFTTLRRLGSDEERPIYVVRSDEVQQIKLDGWATHDRT